MPFETLEQRTEPWIVQLEDRLAERAKRERNQRAELIRRGMHKRAVYVKRVLCADGRRRHARITSSRYLSILASVNVQGKTVSGYVLSVVTDNGEQDYAFHAIIGGKNSSLLAE